LARAVTVPVVRRPTVRLLKVGFRALGFPSSITDADVAQTLQHVAAVDFAAQVRNTARLAVPTLTAWAEDDPLIEDAIFLEHAAALPPGPRLRWVEGGHNIQKTHAVELAAALAELAANPLRPRS